MQPVLSFERDDQAQHGPLALAVVLSLLVHAVVLAISYWVPIESADEQQPAAEQETLLTFNFSEANDPTAANAMPLGQVPLDLPPTQATPWVDPSDTGQENAPDVPVMPDPRASITPNPIDAPNPTAAETAAESSDLRDAPEPEPEEQRTDVPEDPAEETSRDDASNEQEVDELEGVAETPEASVDDRNAIAPRGGASGPRSLTDSLRSFSSAVQRARARNLQRPAATRGTHQTTFVPEAGDLPVAGAPYGVLEFSSRDYDWGDYARQIYERILKAWYRRIDQSTNEFERWGRDFDAIEIDDQVKVVFTIEASGDVSGISVVVPSRTEPLDLSATDALEEVILPPLPPDFPRESEEVRATFLMRVVIPELRPMFRFLRQSGWLD